MTERVSLIVVHWNDTEPNFEVVEQQVEALVSMLAEDVDVLFVSNGVPPIFRSDTPA